MNVYVESNFVLELALLQEQQASCEEILRLSEASKVHLVIPAYSIAEPYVVYAAVLSHLKQHGTTQSCFLNRNSKDFDDPDLVEELNAYNCKLLAQFDIGYQFICSCLSQDTEPA